MKKRLVTILLLAFTATSLVACGSSSNVAESTADTTIETDVATAEPTATQEPTEAPHEHNYVETITTEATCEADGEATYTCECGDSYTESITAVGHIFETYVSNEDATYTADGTETATCSNCEATDTRVAEGSMLTYSFTDMDATMYAQQTVNVRSLPNTDGEKLGSLSTNDEVKVTGQCVETGWYRFELDGTVAYASNSYLGNDKVVEQPKAEAPAQATVDNSVFPYELYKVYDDGGLNVYYFMYEDRTLDIPQERARCDRESSSILNNRYPNLHRMSNWAGEIVTYGGVRYEKRYSHTIYDVNGNVIDSLR